MQDLHSATDNFVAVISDPVSSNEEVNAALQPCFALLANSSEADINTFMQRLMSLYNLPDIERGTIALTVCGYLVENGFPSEAALEQFIDIYEERLDKAAPFFQALTYHINNIKVEGEDRDQEINRIYSELINDQELVDSEMYTAIISLDKFYTCGISLFSINRENFETAKSRLAEKVTQVSFFSQGCYWISKLFTVLFDEPVTIIDIDQMIGFEGRINGVVDNYQLQHLLMGIPILNGGESAISAENLAIANGTGPQTSDNSIECKWNLYSIHLCSQPEWRSLINNKENPAQSIAFKDSWIWSEGAPEDIPAYRNRRVILLGLPAYSRSSRAQRTFKNLKASIEIDKVLTEEEIEQWLNPTL